MFRPLTTTGTRGKLRVWFWFQGSYSQWEHWLRTVGQWSLCVLEYKSDKYSISVPSRPTMMIINGVIEWFNKRLTVSRLHAGIRSSRMCSDARLTPRRARMWIFPGSAATLKGGTDRCCRGPVDDESSKSNGAQRDGERWKRCEIKIQWAFKNKVWGRTRMGWEGRWVRKVKGNSATNTVYGCLWSPRILRCLDSNVDR